MFYQIEITEPGLSRLILIQKVHAKRELRLTQYVHRVEGEPVAWI